MTTQVTNGVPESSNQKGHHQNRFNDYLSNAIDIIRKRNPDITHDNEKAILDAIGPKVFYPDSPSSPKKGILLIHGMLDSCAIMSSLYDYYSQKDYFVKNLLLPGHGTVSSDLCHIKWEEWIHCCQMAVNAFKEEVEELYVLGLSTGACLATHLALQDAPIDKLVLFAPAFGLKTNATWLISICQYINTHFPIPIREWVIKQEENEIGKYRSIAVNGVYQLMTLISHTTPHLLSKTLKQPLYMILSADDETISNKTALSCYQAQSHPSNRLLYFRNDDKMIDLKGLTILPSCLPEERILNFSHICLTVSPRHKLFGQSVSTDPKLYLGANTPANLINYHFKRLSYNPHFDKMLSSIDQFLEAN